MYAPTRHRSIRQRTTKSLVRFTMLPFAIDVFLRCFELLSFRCQDVVVALSCSVFNIVCAGVQSTATATAGWRAQDINAPLLRIEAETVVADAVTGTPLVLLDGTSIANSVAFRFIGLTGLFFVFFKAKGSFFFFLLSLYC